METMSHDLRNRSTKNAQIMPQNHESTYPNTTSISDELVNALKSEVVLNAMGKALMPFIQLAVDESVKKTLAELYTSVRNIAEENKQLKEKTTNLSQENIELKKRITEVENSLKIADKNEKSHNIIINGLPERTYAERATDSGVAENAANTHSSVEESVLDLLNNKLKMKIRSEDIAVAYRLKKARNDQIRPVFVKFVSRKYRDNVVAAKKQLINDSIFISEHLTKEVADLFFMARGLKRDKKLHSAWTKGGQLYIKLNGDPNTAPKLIKSQDDLPANSILLT